jgi:hypothetical protein
MPVPSQNEQTFDSVEEIAPSDVLDAQGINMDSYSSRLDAVFDQLDASYNPALDSNFQASVDQAIMNEAVFVEGYLNAKKDEPKTETVIVTGRRSSGLGGTVRPIMGGIGLGALLSNQQRANIRQNLKNLFAATDAEIDALLAQIQNSPSAMLALARIGNIPVNQQTGVATMKNSQIRTISGVLRSLNTTESINALNRMNGAIRAGRIRVIRG